MLLGKVTTISVGEVGEAHGAEKIEDDTVSGIVVRALTEGLDIQYRFLYV